MLRSPSPAPPVRKCATVSPLDVYLLCHPHGQTAQTLLFPQPFPWLSLCPSIPASLSSTELCLLSLLFGTGSCSRPETVSYSSSVGTEEAASQGQPQ